MKALLSFAVLLAQTATTPPDPWRGSLAQGLAEVQRLSEAEKPDEALELAERILSPGKFARWRERATARPGWKRKLVEAADPLLAAVGLSDLSPSGRAAVHFARGVVLARDEKRRPEAAEAFEKSRSLAGPGDLRLDATYDLGWTALTEGEAFRAQIPELGGKPAAQPAPPAPGAAAPPAPPDPKPDPLELARAAYLKAREHFVERLKSDARDADTRANTELVQNRLRELAEIQKKREEEKKKQEQEKQDQQKNDPNKKDQDKKDQDKKDPSSQDQDQKKPDDQQKSDEKDKAKDEEKQPPKDQESDADKDKEKKEAQPQSAKEGPLTKEEIMRLLDTLKNREEEGKKILEQLRRARRAKVKKDW